MFIVRFYGGLGNQMFQASFLKSLEKVYYNQQVYADLSAYRLTDFHNGYELKNIFGIELPEASDFDIRKLSHYRPWHYGRMTYRIINRISLLLTGESYKLEDDVLTIFEFNEYRHNDDQLSNIWDLLGDDVFFDGYWQKSFFYKPIENELKDIFRFRDEDYNVYDKLIREMDRRESVSVHVRRGDYVGTAFDCISEDYYDRAIAWFQDQVEKPHFYFFSDDLSYVESKFDALTNKTLVYGNSGDRAYFDMLLMTRCKHHIIANSTFSYWGAKLGYIEEGYVVAPSVFSNNKEKPLAEAGWVIL